MTMKAYTHQIQHCVVNIWHCTSSFADVVVGFEFPNYSVDEDEGPLEVCALVREGGFQVPLTVRVTSTDNTATGL